MESPSRPVPGYPPPGYPNATAGTGYPYAAPPPIARPYSVPGTTFYRRFLAILIASFLIAGTVVFITWLALRPHLPKFRVESVNLSNFNISPSSSLISGNWDVRLTVRNPNRKITLYFDHIAASVFYKAESLVDTTVPPFVLGRRTETAVRATFAAAEAYVDRWVVYGINGDLVSRGGVDFNVRMLVAVRYRAGAWRGGWRLMRVYCGELPVGISSNGSGGTLLGGAWQCDVGG